MVVIDESLDAMASGEEQILSPHLVVETDAERRAAAQGGDDLQRVIIICGPQEDKSDFQHRHQVAAGFEVTVVQTLFFQQRGSCHVQPARIGGFGNKPHLIGFRITGGDQKTGGDHGGLLLGCPNNLVGRERSSVGPMAGVRLGAGAKAREKISGRFGRLILPPHGEVRADPRALRISEYSLGY